VFNVKIIPPNAELPLTTSRVYEDVEVEDYVADTDGESVEGVGVAPRGRT